MAPASLLRSAGPLVAGRAASAVVTFALPIVLARALDQTQYGTYKQIFLAATLALNSLQFGLAQSLYYFLPRTSDPDERRAMLRQTHQILALVGLAAALSLWACGPIIAQRFSNPHILEVALPTGLLAGLLVAASPLDIALTAGGRPGWSAVSAVASDALRAIAMLVPVLLGHGVLGLAWGACAASAVRWLASLAVSGGGLLSLPSRFRLSRQIAYAIPYGLAVLLAMPQQQMHQFFVAARATPAVFAIYAVGCMQIPVVGLLYAPVSDVLQVRLATLERTGELHRAGEVFAEAVERLAMVFLPLCATLVALSGPAVRLLYGAPYAPAADVMRVAVASVAIASLPVDGVLRARARTGTLLAVYAGKLAATWPMLALGWSAFGMIGAVGAHVVVEACTKAVLLGVVARETRLPALALVRGAKLGRSMAVALAAGAAAAAVSQSVRSPLWACLAGGLAAAGIAGADLFLRTRGAHSRREVPSAAQARAAS